MGKCLPLREDKVKGVVEIAGVAEKPVADPSMVLNLLQQGNRYRKTEATMANQVSSRSHAVLQLMLRRTKTTSCGREAVITSKLSLIDLAGSERASATQNRGARLNEGANINKSLLALANCIKCKVSGFQAHSSPSLIPRGKLQFDYDCKYQSFS